MIINNSTDEITTSTNIEALNLWQEWKPSWTGKNHTPHDNQERHSPTEKVEIKTPQSKNHQEARRRIVDNRLWNAMSSAQQHAAIQINIAFEMMSQGLGYSSSNWEKIPGCKNPSNITEARSRMINFYLEWVKKCAEKELSHSMVVDILCFGFNCKMIDNDRRLRKGSTRKNLIKSLALYCELHGWE